MLYKSDAMKLLGEGNL